MLDVCHRNWFQGEKAKRTDTGGLAQYMSKTHQNFECLTTKIE